MSVELSRYTLLKHFLQTLKLFDSEHASVVVGSIGLSDSFSYAALGLINTFIISREEDERMFLWFFLTLACCALLAVPVTLAVRSVPDTQQRTQNDGQIIHQVQTKTVMELK